MASSLRRGPWGAEPAALAAVGAAWLLLAAQPLASRLLGDPGAASACFGAAALGLLATRPATRRSEGAGRAARRLGIGLVVGLASLPVGCALAALVAGAPGLPSRVGAGLRLGPPLPARAAEAAWLPALLVLGPLFEELLYRERLLGALARRVPWRLALPASSLAFALPHPEPRVQLAAFGVGLGLGAAWLATRSLALCVGLHAGLNLAVQLAGSSPR